jgi:hypothetical protein
VETDCTTDWYPDLAAARKRFDENAKGGSEYMISQAEIIDNSPHLEWTSDEYYFAALLRFPEVDLVNGQPEGPSIDRIRAALEKASNDMTVFLIEFEGESYGKYGSKDLDPSHALDKIAEYYEL